MANRFIETVKKTLGLERRAPGIEFYPENDSGNDDGELRDWLAERFREAEEAAAPLKRAWEQNRKAYMGETRAAFGSLAAVHGRDGHSAHYSSAIVADKIEDLIAIQVSTPLVVYPLPDVIENSPALAAAPDIAAGKVSPAVFVRRIWEKYFQDVQERQRLRTKDIQVALDGWLCQTGVTKVYQGWDHENQREDVKVDVVQPEDFLVDPAATSIEDARWCFHKTWLTAFELAQRHPENHAEILAAVIDTDDAADSAAADKRARKGLVCIVESYFRDDTAITVNSVRAEIDPETGAARDIHETIETRKYPTGRRVTFIARPDDPRHDGIIILKDEPNPYFTFPFAVFTPKTVSWSRHGRNAATPLRTLQWMDDQVWQQGMANVKAAGNAMLVVEEGALVNEEAIDNTIMQLVKVTHQGGIHVLGAKPILGDIASMHMQISADADRISGVNATSEGRGSGSVSSGRAFQILSENTNRKVLPAKDCFRDFKQRQARLMASIMLDLGVRGLALRVSDDDALPVKLPFDLVDVTSAIDVRVDGQSDFPVDPVSRFNMMVKIAEMRDENGVPYIDRKGMLEVLKIPGMHDINRRIEARAAARAAAPPPTAAPPRPPMPQAPPAGGSRPLPPLPADMLQRLRGGMGGGMPGL